MSKKSNNMSLGVKLAVGFAIPMLIIAALTVGVVVATSQVKSQANLARTESAVFAGIAQQMKLDVVQTQQWLTDISATRAQDGLDDGFDEAAKSRKSFLAGLSKFKEMFQEENDSASLKLTGELEEAYDGYYEAGKKMAQAYIDGGAVVGNQQMASFDATASSLIEKLDPFVETQIEELNEAMETVESASNSLVLGSMIGGVVALVIGVLLAWLITRSITKPINRIIEGLSAGADQTTSAAGQVSGAGQSLAQGASEQAASVEEISSSIEESSSMTKQNAANANEAKALAATAQAGAEKGSEAMTRMSTAIDDIKKSSDETAKIVKTIDEIAFQTNLLALNAAVEAARAGDAGKGFAVVAEEVRNLSQRSAEAARNTADMIEGAVKNADNGVQISKEVGAALEEIADGSRKVNDLVGEIASASDEQAKGVEQISAAVTQMDTVTQSNASNAEESASAAEELSAQAEELKRMVVELQTVVGGASASTGQATSAKSPKQHVSDAGHRYVSERIHDRLQAQPKASKAKARTAEELIPMDADSNIAAKF